MVPSFGDSDWLRDRLCPKLVQSEGMLEVQQDFQDMALLFPLGLYPAERRPGAHAPSCPMESENGANTLKSKGKRRQETLSGHLICVCESS